MRRGYCKEEFVEKALKVPAHTEKQYSYENFQLRGARDNSYVTCPKHGDFLTSRNNHLRGKGCPKCCIRGTSFPEKVFYYYINKVFKCLPNHKIEINNQKYEVDIFVPELNLVVEYDGKRFHNSEKSIIKDTKKTKSLNDFGIVVFRIREDGLIKISSNLVYNFDITSCKPNFKGVLEEIFIRIQKIYDKQFKIPSIEIEKDQKTIYSILINQNKITKSLKFVYPELIKYWHPTKNLPLTPDQIHCHSPNKVWWLYECGHEVEQVVHSAALGHKCKFCFKDQPKKIYQYSMSGYYITSYNSIYELQKLGFIRANVNKCLKGEREYANGYRWSRDKVEKLSELQYKARKFNLKPNCEDLQFLKWFNKYGIKVSFNLDQSPNLIILKNALKQSYPCTFGSIIRLYKAGLIEKYEENQVEYWKPLTKNHEI